MTSIEELKSRIDALEERMDAEALRTSELIVKFGKLYEVVKTWTDKKIWGF